MVFCRTRCINFESVYSTNFFFGFQDSSVQGDPIETDERTLDGERGEPGAPIELGRITATEAGEGFGDS